MKALLLKDFYMIKSYCRSSLLIIVIFFFLGFANSGEVFFITAYPTFMLSLMSTTLLAYEEREKWNAYSATLPFSRAVQVSEKYVLSLMCAGVSFLYILIETVVQWKVLSHIDGEYTFSSILICVILSLLYPSMMLPVFYKFGAEKGRMLYLCMTGLIFAVAAALAVINPPISSLHLPAWLSDLGAPVLLMLIAAGFVGSWKLSIRFYEAKEL